MRRTLSLAASAIALTAAFSVPRTSQASMCLYRDCINQLDECVYDFGLPPEQCTTAYDACVGLCRPR